MKHSNSGSTEAENMSNTHSDGGTVSNYDEVSRRRAMQLGVGAAAALATAGVATAAGGNLNYGSELTPNPEARGLVSIEEVDVGSDPLEYVDDDGTTRSLAEFGAQIRTRDDEDEPLNPVRFYAFDLESDELSAFPRGVDYELDEETHEVSALDPDYWTVDADLTVSEYTPPSGGSGLSIAGGGLTDGAEATMRFDDGTDGDGWSWEISSGELRRYLQVGLNVVDLPADATVEIRVEDSTGTVVSTSIDSTLEDDEDDVIATGTTTSQIYQVQLGDIASGLDTIEAVEIAMQDNDAEIEIFALNVERESRWTFGVEEYLDEDDDLQTSTIYQPSGEIQVRSVGDLSDSFGNAVLHSPEYEVALAASRVDDSLVDVDPDADPGRYRFDERLEVVQNIEIPTSYDLSWGSLELVEEVRHPSDRYNAVKSATGLEEAQEIADIEDLDTTDRTPDMEDAAEESVVVLETTASPGETVVVYHDLLLTESEHDELTSTAAIGGPVGSSGGSFLSTPLGIATAIGSGVVGYLAIARGWLGSLAGR